MTAKPWVVSALLLLLSAGCSPVRRSGAAGQSTAAVELTASFPLAETRDTVWMELFVPAVTGPVRGVVAFIDRGLDRYAYDDRDWRAMCQRVQCALLRLGLPRQDALPPRTQLVRNASRGGDAALLHALRLAAERTHRPELHDAKVLIFGHSAAGSFGPTFAGAHPDRTIGFIRYHANLRGLDVDTTALANIPALSVAGGQDENAGDEDAKALWQAMRARGAPWAHVTHVGQPHSSIDGLVEAGSLMRDWAEAVLTIRTAAGASSLTPMDGSRGWVVNDSTGVVAPIATLGSVTPRSSWLPNERTALGLRLLSGLCASVGLPTAVQLLGAGTRVAGEDISVCHYMAEAPRRELWLSANRLATTGAARAELAHASQAANGRALTNVGDAGFVAADAQRRCGTVGVARSVFAYYVSLCGDGFGTVADSARLYPLIARLVGSQ